MRYDPKLVNKSDIVDLRKKPKGFGNGKNKGNSKSLEKRYTSLKAKREPFLDRARTFSDYTKPNLYPINSGMSNQGDGTNTTGWQSLGAQCVNNLTNKLVMTLFPPHSSFARLEITPEAKSVLRADDINIIQQQGSLINAEKAAMLEHEKRAGRVAIGSALEHLLVGGTTCLYMPSEGNVINYPLDRFVVRMDKSQNLLELIIEEHKALDTFDEETQEAIKSSSRYMNRRKDDDEVTLYTQVKLTPSGMYSICQEAMEVPVGKRYRVRKDKNPFVVLRWETNYGEDYGRSLVEQYSGDFHAVQFLSEAIAKGCVLMADIKYLVKSGATTDIDHLINSPTGEFINGNIDDIGILQLDKFADFTMVANVLEKYERRVGSAFLLGRAVQRDAERVTQAEIRRDALEMEQSLGGAYSLLANTLQRPYFRLLLDRIGFELPENLVNTVLMTGIEALSKLSESDKYLQWAEAVSSAAALPPQTQDRLKWGDFSQYHANQLSFEIPFMMTDEEYQEKKAQEAKAQQQQAMMEAAVNAAPQVASNMTKQGQ